MKLVLDKMTRKILNVGEPPWSNMSDLSPYDVVEVSEAPANAMRCFYRNGAYEVDTTPTESEKCTAVGMATLKSHNGTKLDNIPMPQLSALVRALIQVDHPDWVNAEGVIQIP